MSESLSRRNRIAVVGCGVALGLIIGYFVGKERRSEPLPEDLYPSELEVISLDGEFKYRVIAVSMEDSYHKFQVPSGNPKTNFAMGIDGKRVLLITELERQRPLSDNMRPLVK